MFFRDWFTSGSKPTTSDGSANVEAAAHKLVDAYLKTLPLGCISTGDYYRLYRTLMDLSVKQQPTMPSLTGRTKLDLLIAHFSSVRVPSFFPKDKSLQLTSLHVEVARWLVRTFPAITSLSLCELQAGEEHAPATVECLLFEPAGTTVACWARQLTRLQFETRCANSQCLMVIIPKLTATNFPQLKQLYLAAHRRLITDTREELVLDLPILRQLITFFVDMADYSFAMIWPTLKTNVNDEPLPPAQQQQRRFMLYQRLAAPLLYEVICTMAPHFAAQIRGLNVKISYRNEEDSSALASPPDLQSLVRKFGSLIALRLSSCSTSGRYTLIQLVTPLPQLIHLKHLVISVKSYLQLPASDEQLPSNVKLGAQLTDVTLVVKTVRHGTFHVSTIVNGIFPAARPMLVTFKRCNSCPKTGVKLREECRRQVLVGAREGDIRFE